MSSIDLDRYDPIDRHLRKEEVALFVSGSVTALAGFYVAMGWAV